MSWLPRGNTYRHSPVLRIKTGIWNCSRWVFGIIVIMANRRYFEVYQAEQLLRLLDNTDELDLPVCIEHRDKPDFVLSTRHLKIGLETSSFTDEEVVRADYLHFTRFPKAFITTTGLRDGASRRPNDEIAETMLSLDSPWEDVADGAEHVVRKIFASIRLKCRKFHSPNFEQYDQNWLLLTDYLNPFSESLTDSILAQHIGTASNRIDTMTSEFDRIYIFYGPRCFRLQKGKLATKLDRKLGLTGAIQQNCR